MDDSAVTTIELTDAEANNVVSALSAYEVEKSGPDEKRVLNIRERFQEEFGFEEASYNEEGIVEEFAEALFDDEATEDVELARAEAKEIVAALAEFEHRESDSETERLDEIRGRFEDTFDLAEGDNYGSESTE